MSVVFARETLTDALWAEALPLLQKHWREVAHFQDIPLDPDRERYDAIDRSGLQRFYTARASGGLLIGYASFVVAANLHYQTSVQAVQDVVYIHPDFRGGTGYRFIAWCDEQLKAEGVQAVYHHVKAAHNFGPLLERQGYDLVDLIYAKRLDTPAVVDRPSTVEALAEAFALMGTH